jgi:hypothetical protein
MPYQLLISSRGPAQVSQQFGGHRCHEGIIFAPVRLRGWFPRRPHAYYAPISFAVSSKFGTDNFGKYIVLI